MLPAAGDVAAGGTMSKRQVATRAARKARGDWPVVVYFWIMSLAVAGYLGARVILDSLPHPVHCASGLAGGVIGYFVGWLWYHWRGDII